MIYAESVDKLVDNAGETGPTILSAVPRVYEKAFNTVVAGGMANPGLQGALFRMAMREFELYAKAKAKGESYSSLAFTLAKKLVFPKVKDKLSKRFGAGSPSSSPAGRRWRRRSPTSSTCSGSTSSRATG